MKVHNKKLRSISVFALVLVLLVSIVLPMSAAGSSPDEAMGTYIVKQGDTLSSIAAAHGVTVSGIVSANGISASADLFVGQKLYIPGATTVDEDSTTTYGYSGSISFDFKDADVSGALATVLAHTGYTMISKGMNDTKITLAMENVSPITAIDYILRMADMTYIKNDNIIYVGTADVLNSNFIDSKALTRVVLKYISSDTLMSQLSTLGISVKVIKSDINLREFWISGYPMELAKTYELIQTLDNKKNITTGSASISSYLTAIEMNHITASEFSGLLSSLGLHTGITMAAHPMTLYVYATGEAYNDIMKIKQLVDYADANASAEGGEGEGTGEGTGEGGEDVVITDGETSLAKVELKYITKEDAASIVSTFGYEVELLGLDLYEKVVWVKGESEEVNDAVARIKENDKEENDASKTMFQYELKNIVASEFQSKAAFVNLEGVEFYYGNYPSLTKSFMVYCSKNKVDEVKALIDSLDNNLGEMYYPITNITSQSELDMLAAKEALVVKFINIPGVTVDCFELSEDLDPAEDTFKYILYVLESPENIDLIINMWNTIG